MTFDTIQKSRTILKILAINGLYSMDNGNDALKIPIYKIIMQILVTFAFTILVWLEIFFSSDLTQATDVLYMSLTLTALSIKILNAWYHYSLTKSMFKEWETNEIFKLKTIQEHLMWQSNFKKFGRVAFLYIVWCEGICVGGGLTVVFLSDTYQLPYPMWTPFDSLHPVYYWYTYVYEVLGMTIGCMTNVALDMCYCYMMQHLALCFELIAMRLENLGKQIFEANRKTTQRLVEIIELDQQVKRMSKQFESIISYPFSIQIMLSAFVICFSLYRAHNINFLDDTGGFLASLQYAVAIALQIFLPCYYANKLTIASTSLSGCLFHCNWPEMSPHNRKLILLYNQNLQEPVVLRAGYFFDIGLPVFAKTIQNSYNFFALLLQMDEE